MKGDREREREGGSTILLWPFEKVNINLAHVGLLCELQLVRNSLVPFAVFRVCFVHCPTVPCSQFSVPCSYRVFNLSTLALLYSIIHNSLGISFVLCELGELVARVASVPASPLLGYYCRMHAPLSHYHAALHVTCYWNWIIYLSIVRHSVQITHSPKTGLLFARRGVATEQSRAEQNRTSIVVSFGTLSTLC